MAKLAKKLVNFRFPVETADMLGEWSEATGRSQNDLAEEAIRLGAEKFLGRTGEGAGAEGVREEPVQGKIGGLPAKIGGLRRLVGEELDAKLRRERVAKEDSVQDPSIDRSDDFVDQR